MSGPGRIASTNEPFSLTADDVLEDSDLAGARVMVTGASSGVGAAIAAAFAHAGATVTLAVRDLTAGELVARDIARQGVRVAPEVRFVDLLAMASVRNLARDWDDRPLDILINNAGLMAPPFKLTADGFESQMAVNFYAPMLLSELLVPALRRARSARVVTVSSGSHHLARLHLEDLDCARRPYDRFEAYGHAKLCANLLTVEYSRRHRDDGISMNAATPGGVTTNLGRHCTFEDAVRLGWVKADGTLPQGRMKTPAEGAATPVWGAVASELAGKGGLYLEDCAIAQPWAPPTPAGWGVTQASLDPAAALALWEAAMEPLGVTAA